MLKKLLDAQVLPGTKKLTVSMDEFYVVPGMGVLPGTSVVVGGTKSRLLEEVSANPPKKSKT